MVMNTRCCHSHRKPVTVMMANELAGTCKFFKSLTTLVTSDTAVGSDGVLESNRFALCSIVMVAVVADDSDSGPQDF